jgi:hypothetical protein
LFFDKKWNIFRNMKVTAGTIDQPDKPPIKFIVGGRPPELSEAAKKKLARQKPSKKAARLMEIIAQAKVAVHY